MRDNKVFEIKMKIHINYDTVEGLQDAFKSLKENSPEIWIKDKEFEIMNDTDPLEIIKEIE